MAQGKLPGTYKAFTDKFPKLHEAHELVNEAAAAAGPLDAKTCLLVKVGVCVGAGLESAVKANVRKAMQAGATTEEIEQAILQAMNSVGFPSTVAAWSWAQQQFEKEG
jgi:alkylhydroperoxidase/carboxymuconolactone decarboxylase family protein YurZ